MHQSYLKDLLKHIFAILRFLNQSIMLILLSYIINCVHIKSDPQYHFNNQYQQKVCYRFATNKCYFNAVPSAAAARSLQSCLTLCDPIDGSPPGPPVPGILQARTLEWVAISFSNAWKWKVRVKSLSHVRRLATPWTEAYQAPLSMGFSRQEYWSGVPLPSPYEVPRLVKFIEM